MMMAAAMLIPVKIPKTIMIGQTSPAAAPTQISA